MNNNIDDIINISVVTGGTVAHADNINACMMITKDTSFLSTSKRIASYQSASQVEADFGTFSNVYKKAQVFFNQKKNPVSVGGVLHIGYWRAEDELLTATAGKLIGAVVNSDDILNTLQSITDGSFGIKINGAYRVITGMDFSSSTSLSEVATVVQVAIRAETSSFETVTYTDGSFVVSSSVLSSSSSVEFPVTHTLGTDISVILGLENGSGAVSINGIDATTELAETKMECLSVLSSLVGFRGFAFIDNVNGNEATSMASWAQSEGKLYYQVFSGDSRLVADTSNPCWNIKLANYKNARCLYSSTGNVALAIAYMSRMHTVNFSGSNTAHTMNLKELVGVVSDVYTVAQIQSLERIGIDYYTDIKGTGRVISNGENGYVDDIYNQIALKLDVQIDAYNTLANSGTKIAQTDIDVEIIKDTVIDTLERYVGAGVIAGGKWNLIDTFGNPEQFENSIYNKGYYVYAESVDDMTDSDRALRKLPPICTAVKFSGATHSVDIILQINL